MSHDDDDDDFVVPSGSRRSSYVPPSEPGEFVPALPDVPEQAAPTSSTGPVPTIGPAGDESIAQTPVFAESVEVPRVESEATGSIVIEVPTEEFPAVENSLDQFGLPVVANPIDIPPVVITDPLPDAVSGTGAVFDDNRLFPPAMTSAEPSVVPEPTEPTEEAHVESLDEPSVSMDGVVEEDPIGEVFGTPAVDDVSADIPSEPTVFVVPERRSLTPEQLAEVLSANGGISSNDQMALLDAQIPLREADSSSVKEFLARIEGLDSEEAQSARVEARRRFGDLVADLLPAVPQEFLDDSTPVTGIPIVEHVEIVEVIEDETGDVLGVAVTEIDEVVVVPETPAAAPSAAVPADDQSWSLSAPADVVSEEPQSVPRRHWWSLIAIIASALSTVMLTTGTVVAQSGSAPDILFVVAGVVAAVPFVEFARRGSSQTGSSWRAALENSLGRVAGRTVAVVIAILTLIALISVLLGALDGLGHELEGSAILGGVLSGVLAAGSTGAALVALTLFAGVVIAALPYRLYRAKVLVLTGWAALGSGSVIAMGAMLLALSPRSSVPGFDPSVTAAGIAASVALVLLASALFGFQDVSRVRDTRSGILWLSIGLGLGGLVLAGTVAAALLTPQGAHYFFGHNPVLHIIAPSAILNVALGASALVPAVVLGSTLTSRFVAAVSARDDREDPNTALRWLLVLVPLGVGAVAYLGYADVLTENLPSLTTIVTPIAAVIGVLAARGIVGRDVRSRAAKRGLLATVLVTTALGLGFASSDGALFEWVGYINAALRPLGYGLLYIDSAAPLATAFLSLVVGLLIVVPSTRRAARNA